MAGGLDLIGTLSQTLSPEGLLSLMQAQQAQQAQELAARTQQATQSAGQAQQAYGQAASAPAPELSPWDQGIPTLLGGLASILQGNQGPSQRAAEGIQQSKAALLQARAQNLQQLRDVYSQKAEEAQKAGDLEQTEKYRSKLDTLHKTLDVVNSNADRVLKREELANKETPADKIKREAVDNVRTLMGKYIEAGKAVPPQLMKRAVQLGIVPAETPSLPGALKPTGAGAAITPETEKWARDRVVTIRDGRQFADLSDITGNAKNALIQWAGTNGIPALGKDQVYELRDIEGARRNIDSIMGQSQAILPTDASERAARAPGTRISALLQTNAQKAAWGTWRTAAIKALRATTGSKSFRMTQSEIALAIKNDIPTLNDTYEVATQKLQNIQTLLDNAQEPLISRNWQKAGGSPQTPPQASDADREYIKSLGLTP